MVAFSVVPVNPVSTYGDSQFPMYVAGSLVSHRPTNRRLGSCRAPARTCGVVDVGAKAWAGGAADTRAATARAVTPSRWINDIGR
jgi:hypothetical protein